MTINNIHVKWLLVLGMFFLGLHVQAQSLSNIRSKTLTVTQDTIQLDSLSIIPGSLKINDITSNSYQLDFAKGQLIFNSYPDTVILVSYKVFPLNISRQMQHKIKNKNSIGPSYNPYNIVGNTNAKSSDIFGNNSLSKNGSISRGINFGNTRDLSVSSNMNLQLSGMVQDIEITAAITDNNIPIQPEGNTQQLQDFDQVYIQFAKDNQKLLAGDYPLSEKNDEFLKYNKKAQGLNYQGLFKSKNGKEFKTNFGAALSRGKFGRNVIIGAEGNQGPYQLSGSENEQFIIILSGTEKVYIDGKLMKRGMDNDYIINYNSGEITFTSNQFITKDKRITVEFQYSDRNYGRTLFNMGNEIKVNNKTTLKINAYSEQDMKFPQLLQTLTEDEKKLLSEVGDSLNEAITPKVDSVEFSNSLVLYEKIDSAIGNSSYTVYKYSTDESKAFYQLSFSKVGHNRGNYVQEVNSVNGRVFNWIAPVNNVPQGEYEPLITIISPKQKQMITAAVEHKFNDKNKLFIEGALSNDNKNLFSSKDKKDDQGVALKSIYSFEKDLKQEKWSLVGNQSYRLVSKNFSAIERFRTVEFERDWSTASSDLPVDEHLIAVQLMLQKEKLTKTSFQSSYIYRGKTYNGLKNELGINFNLWKGAAIKGNGSFLQAEGTVTNSQFLRHKFSLTQNIHAISLKVYEQQESKLSRYNSNDSIINAASNDNFNLFGAEISTKPENDVQFSVDYSHRYDYLPQHIDMKLATISDNYGVSFQREKKNSFLKLKSGLRQLKIVDTTLTTADAENTLLNRIEYNFKLWKGLISSKSFFELGTGNELKREFTYVEANLRGQGIYAWNDYNGDGVQQLNEFVITEFSDLKNYIRVFLPSTEYIRTYSNQLTQSLNINPARYFKRNNKFKKVITRFSNQAYLRLNQKNAKENSDLVTIPFNSSINDTSLISINSSFRNTIYFNRSNPIFGLNYTITDNRNKNLLLHGYDARQLYSQSINLRWNMFKIITFQSKIEKQNKLRSSEIFSSDDYSITSDIIEPKILIQTNSTFRFTLSGAYKSKQNDTFLGNESSIYQKLGAGINYSLAKRGRLNFNFNYITTTYSDSTDQNSSPLQFEMLEGLQIGDNFTWTLQFQQTFKNNLQANITYEGRRSPGFKVVHTGGFQIQLLF